MIIPHYLLTCYSSSEKETLQDLLSDRTIDISEFQSIDFLQHHFFDLHGLSPHVIVLRCLPPFSSVLLPVQLPNTPIHLQNYRVLIRTNCDSRFVVAPMSNLFNQTQMQLSFNILLLQTLLTRILLTLCLPLVLFSSLSSPLSILYSTFFLVGLFSMYLREHCSLSTIRDYFRPVSKTPSIWRLDGGKDGVWRRQEEACITTESSYTMYYSEATHQLLWLPSQCCPGVPATHVNVRALYDEELSIKLRWFYSQIAQLSTDKRIRIILNRRTVLHDTLLAFATLTKEDMAKQIRLQFNGEVSH